MPKIGKYSREQAVGKMKNAAGKTVIFTKGGVNIKSRAGDHPCQARNGHGPCWP